MTNAEKTLLKHLRKPWTNIINKSTFYVLFLTNVDDRTWTPRGPTGATVNALMRKGILDFEPKPGRFGKLVRIGR